MAWKIRFCNGLNQGVEVTLAPGRLVIGCDPAVADLVLVDLGIVGEHVVLEVSEEQVRLLEWAQDQPPTQDGEAVAAGEPLRAFAQQACGALRWMFCAQSEQFDPGLQTQVAVVSLAAKTDRPGWVRWAVGLGCVGLFTLAMLLAPWLNVSPAVQLPEPVQGIRDYLQQQGLVNVALAKSQPGGEVVLTGYLPTTRQLSELQQFLEGGGVPFRLDVRAQEDIRRDVDSILPRLGYKGVSVDTDRVGWVRLSGADIADPARWQQIVQTLKSDVQGLQGVEDPPTPEADPLRRLQQLLGDAGLADQLNAVRKGDRFELDGALGEREQDVFKQVAVQFAAEFPALPALQLKSTSAARKKPTVQFPIRAVSIGRVPYVILTDNRRYPIEGVTPTGVRVVDIQNDRVVVSKQGQQFIINLKGDAGSDQ
ncbi:type III secretion system inner membrane ring subunit SctD [Pseudomonas entomophila]|uniref:type III secretion system inner membrane ring subunit SctD n=1 Tax=Pseudomonas entomophila TaxID=312306 RepID=UPI002404D7EC|nr:type III secretion system inner membrane ring subunit SctD [Pseudomonas entomophila]MDF9618777.1 type III secretion system inner membrane ring subunit SctD [Pseudomonas entomophila]